MYSRNEDCDIGDLVLGTMHCDGLVAKHWAVGRIIAIKSATEIHVKKQFGNVNHITNRIVSFNRIETITSREAQWLYENKKFFCVEKSLWDILYHHRETGYHVK